MEVSWSGITIGYGTAPHSARRPSPSPGSSAGVAVRWAATQELPPLPVVRP